MCNINKILRGGFFSITNTLCQVNVTLGVLSFLAAIS